MDYQLLNRDAIYNTLKNRHHERNFLQGVLDVDYEGYSLCYRLTYD